MSDLLNSPFILPIVFPSLTVLVIFPLLRWVASGSRSDVVASASVGLACFIALVCAYGRPNVMLEMGPSAVAYGLGACSFLSLLYTFYISNSFIRFILCVMTLITWCWLIVGGPLNKEALAPVLIFGLLVMGLCGVVVLRTRWELIHHKAQNPFISLSIALLTLGLIAYFQDSEGAWKFALGLGMVTLSVLILHIPTFSFSFHENAVLPVSLCCVSLAGSMWDSGDLPVASLLCITMIFFARPAALKMVSRGPAWFEKISFVFVVLFCLFPAILALVFFDILRVV